MTDLEPSAAPTPLAGLPPVTIGELIDVPAPGSSIASAWAQEVTRRSVHRFASTAARDTAYPAAAAGVGAMCEVNAILYISNGTAWFDVAQTGAKAWAIESRLLGEVTYGTAHDWTPPGVPAVEYAIPSVPGWATKAIIRCDLLAVYQFAGATPMNATFYLLHAGPSGGAGGTTISKQAISLFTQLNSQRLSLSWSCLAAGPWVAGDKVQIGCVQLASTTVRFDSASTALFDITWLP